MLDQDKSQSVLGLVSVLNELSMQALYVPLRKAELAMGTFQLLSAVRAGQSKLTQTELADRLGITPPSLCEAVQSAAAKGYVIQKSKVGDKRARVVVLTKTGSRKIDAAVKAIEELDAMLVKQASSENLDITIRTLRAWIQATSRKLNVDV